MAATPYRKSCVGREGYVGVGHGMHTDTPLGGDLAAFTNFSPGFWLPVASVGYTIAGS